MEMHLVEDVLLLQAAPAKDDVVGRTHIDLNWKWMEVTLMLIDLGGTDLRSHLNGRYLSH